MAFAEQMNENFRLEAIGFFIIQAVLPRCRTTAHAPRMSSTPSGSSLTTNQCSFRSRGSTQGQFDPGPSPCLRRFDLMPGEHALTGGQWNAISLCSTASHGDGAPRLPLIRRFANPRPALLRCSRQMSDSEQNPRSTLQTTRHRTGRQLDHLMQHPLLRVISNTTPQIFRHQSHTRETANPRYTPARCALRPWLLHRRRRIYRPTYGRRSSPLRPRLFCKRGPRGRAHSSVILEPRQTTHGALRVHRSALAHRGGSAHEAAIVPTCMRPTIIPDQGIQIPRIQARFKYITSHV